jgi:hypothetical protein
LEVLIGNDYLLRRYIEKLDFRFKAIFGTFSKVIPTLITYLRVMFVRIKKMKILYKIIYFYLDDLLYICNDW